MLYSTTMLWFCHMWHIIRAMKPFDALRASGETAPYRHGPSFPARTLYEMDLLEGKIFDWGCGFGVDLAYFRGKGFTAEGWDPVHKKETPPSTFAPESFNLVHCAFVLNTLADPNERIKVLQQIHDFLPANGHLSLTVRSESDISAHKKPTWKKYGDGWITTKGTFQRGYTAEQLVKVITPLYKDIIVIARNPLFVIASPS